MTVNTFHGLYRHINHEVTIAAYGPENNPQNVTIECLDCQLILFELNK